MTNADQFLDLYKVLEDLLEAKYREMGRPVTNTVYQYVCDKESAPFREKLDLCRQVRNLLTHSADIGGQAPVEPSGELIKELQNVVDCVKRPPLALTRATEAAKLLKATANTRVKWLMTRMAESGYSHVPVLDAMRVTGVFSVSTPFTRVVRGDRGYIDKDTRIGDIMPSLALAGHMTERFVFVAPDTTCPQARELFRRKTPRSIRVAAIFVTEDGSADAKLLGMLTPWDLMAD